MSTPNALEPFEIDIADAVLTDLQTRLRNTRFPPDPGNEDWFYGVPTSYMKDLVSYWINDFDWRAVEAQINAYQHFKTEVDGVPIHFMHKPGKGPAPVPLLVMHGWPWTFWFYKRIIDPLADPAAFGGDPLDAFDVWVPSLPGFAFSTPVPHDMNFWKMADLLHTVFRDRLGHDKYAIHASDYGALVAGQLGHKYADELYGIHLCHDIPLQIFQSERPWDLTEGQLVPDGVSDQLREEILLFQRVYASHVAVHMLDATTISHGFSDSPAGVLAWILKRWKLWSDRFADFEEVFPREDVIANATIWWVTNCAASSIRSYTNAARYPWRPSHDRQPPIEAPTAFTLPAGDIYPPGANNAEERKQAFLNGPTKDWFNWVTLNATDNGGHFAPYEIPEPIIRDIRAHFKTLR